MDELQAIKTRLANLAQGKPTANRRAEVEALLESKWEGVQVSAPRVLGDWGGPESVAALRRWLDRVIADWRCVVQFDALDPLTPPCHGHPSWFR